ncbi:hypothetical protein, partial [Kaarinaea lacus]
MNDHPDSRSFSLEPADNQRLATLCGQFNANLRQVESRLGVEINNRGNSITVMGDTAPIQVAEEVLKKLYEETGSGDLSAERVHLLLQESASNDSLVTVQESEVHDISITTRKGLVRGRGINQKR